MSPLLHHKPAGDLSEKPEQMEIEHPRAAEHAHPTAMRAAVDLCADALIQALVNARKF